VYVVYLVGFQPAVRFHSFLAFTENPYAFKGFVNLPLSKFEEWGNKLTGEGAILDAEKDTVVMCHHGMR